MSIFSREPVPKYPAQLVREYQQWIREQGYTAEDYNRLSPGAGRPARNPAVTLMLGTFAVLLLALMIEMVGC